MLALYPEEPAVLARDLEVHEWLAERGLRLPRLLAADRERRQVLLEDLGPADAEASLAALPPARREALVPRLVDPLAVLAAQPPHLLPRWNPPLDADRLRWELAGFELWFVRHLAGVAPPAWLDGYLDRLAATVAAHPRRVCHRDYHLNNLFLLADGAVGVIDAQDVLVGPDTYDLASLIGERAFPDLVPAATADALAVSWAARTGAGGDWPARLAAVRLQRGLKVLGTFARLVLSGRPHYARWLHPLARRLGRDAPTLGAPDQLAALLLDLISSGGADVR